MSRQRPRALERHGEATSICLAAFSATVPMGQQRYERRLRSELDRGFADRASIRARDVVPLRATGRAGVHVPLRVVWRLPYRLAVCAGRAAYGPADLVHRLDLRCPPAPREVVTIHDVAALRFGDETSLPAWAAHSARRAAAVICPSAFAAREVGEFLGVEHAYVVHNGVDPGLGHLAPLSDAELAQLGLRHPLVVHAGGATVRKNLEALAGAWARVAAADADAHLALCGPPSPRRDELFATLPRAVRLGYRDSSLLARVLRSAAVVVVPSTYEGFGLPALEAMAAGAAVVAAACGALPEVCGDGALLTEPSPEAIAAAVLRALHGGEEIELLRARGRARAAGFSWERTARETFAVYEEVLS